MALEVTLTVQQRAPDARRRGGSSARRARWSARGTRPTSRAAASCRSIPTIAWWPTSSKREWNRRLRALTDAQDEYERQRQADPPSSTDAAADAHPGAGERSSRALGGPDDPGSRTQAHGCASSSRTSRSTRARSSRRTSASAAARRAPDASPGVERVAAPPDAPRGGGGGRHAPGSPHGCPDRRRPQ